MYDSVEMAKYIAAYWNEKRADVNMTKIQKLLYIAYGSWLVIKDGERLVDEHPQAWPYGPVFPTTRNKLLKEDLNAIDKNWVSNALLADKDVSELLGNIYDTFYGWAANELSAWSHKEGSPWELTVSQPDFKWGKQIQDEYIKSYFEKTLLII